MVTHEHPDHLDADAVRAALQASPDLKLWANPSVTAQFTEFGDRVHETRHGDVLSAAGLDVRVYATIMLDHGNFMTRGFDHTAQLAFSHNAAAGRLLGMTEPQIANAIAMAASSDASFAVIRAKPLSQWKGLASAQSALGSMNTLFLARRGVEGPLRVVEGPNADFRVG